MPSNVPPFLIFFVGALLVLLVRGLPRKILLLAIPIVGAFNVWGVQDGFQLQYELLGYTLTPVRADRLSLLFGYLFHLAAFIAITYSLHLKREDNDTVQHFAGLIYAGSAIGAVFAGDFITLFIFWELLAISSVFLIWTRKTPESLRAGMRYLLVHVLSGVTLLAGAMVLVHRTGDPTFGFIGLEGLAGWLIFLALGVKAAFPLLHSWLIDMVYSSSRRMRHASGLLSCPKRSINSSISTTSPAKQNTPPGFPAANAASSMESACAMT